MPTVPETDTPAEVDELAEGEFRWMDAKFRMAEKIGRMPAVRFAKIASLGTDSSELAGMAAMYDLLKACVHPDDWHRFEEHADSTAASDDELWGAIRAVLREQANRPTSRPSDSSDGPSDTEPSSTSTPAGRAIARLDGRPDLQLAVKKAQREMQAAV